MTQALTVFKDHTLNFVRSYLASPDNFGQVQGEAKDFLGTAARVIFAVVVFFALEALHPMLPFWGPTVLAQVVICILPETSLGIGTHLFYKAIFQLQACFVASSPEMLLGMGMVNLISGAVAWTWYDNRYKKGNYISEKLDRFAEYFAPIVANRITGKDH